MLSTTGFSVSRWTLIISMVPITDSGCFIDTIVVEVMSWLNMNQAAGDHCVIVRIIDPLLRAEQQYGFIWFMLLGNDEKCDVCQVNSFWDCRVICHNCKDWNWNSFTFQRFNNAIIMQAAVKSFVFLFAHRTFYHTFRFLLLKMYYSLLVSWN